MLKKIKKIIILILIMINITIFTLADDEEVENTESYLKEIIETSASATDELSIESKYAVAFDRNSKTVIWGKDENKEVAMASTTKIMTAIILLENKKDCLNEEVEVCKSAGSIGGSRLGLKSGDKITINDLLFGLMLCSGNDAAIQIAVAVSGNVDNFVELMNKKAEQMGLIHTHFTSPHGLDNENHYTTATELAIMADYAMKIDEIVEVVNTKNYNVKINGYEKNITNTNELLGVLEGVNGVKTGFTNNAGRCLVTSVSRENFDIIVVVLGAETKKMRTKDSIKIIEFVYKNYELINIENLVKEEYVRWKEINENRIIVNKGNKDVKTKLGNMLYKFYPVKKENISDIKIIIDSKFYYEAPLNEKEKIGTIKVCVGTGEILKADILNKIKIDKKEIFDYLNEFLTLISNSFELNTVTLNNL